MILYLSYFSFKFVQCMLKSSLIGLLMLAVRTGKTWNLSDQISQVCFCSHKASGGLAKLSSTSVIRDQVPSILLASSPVPVCWETVLPGFLGFLIWSGPSQGRNCWQVCSRLLNIKLKIQNLSLPGTFKKKKVPFFPGGQVVRFCASHCRGHGSNPWTGTESH